jgi:large subunit ribosomal protein L31
MKANIHPTWNETTKVTCACGNTFTTGSVLPEIRVEICAKCHPFFTGQQKFVDTLGQVDKFQRRQEDSKKKAEVKKAVIEARRVKGAEDKKEKPSLKDLLMQARKQTSA